MNIEISNLLSELQIVSDDTQKTFGRLSTEQINWKPSADGWSVGQCFEHLIKTNEMFYDELDKIADERAVVLFSKIGRRFRDFSEIC